MYQAVGPKRNTWIAASSRSVCSAKRYTPKPGRTQCCQIASCYRSPRTGNPFAFPWARSMVWKTCRASRSVRARTATPFRSAKWMLYRVLCGSAALRPAGSTYSSIGRRITRSGWPMRNSPCFLPPTCFLQDKLGATNAPGFDINAACSGFLYSLYIADSFIKSGQHRRILVAGTEVLSKITDWDDRTTCVLFGDGAGAVIVEPSDDDSGILSIHINSDGKMWDLIHVPGGGSRNPVSRSSIEQRMHYIKMKGNETFKVAVRTLEDIALKTLEENNMDPSSLSLLIPHQANLRIIQATADRLKMPMDKVIINLDKYGNTSAASIPIALNDALQSGRIKEGDYILLEAFGGGLHGHQH